MAYIHRGKIPKALKMSTFAPDKTLAQSAAETLIKPFYADHSQVADVLAAYPVSGPKSPDKSSMLSPLTTLEQSSADTFISPAYSNPLQ